VSEDFDDVIEIYEDSSDILLKNIRAFDLDRDGERSDIIMNKNNNFFKF